MGAQVPLPVEGPGDVLVKQEGLGLCLGSAQLSGGQDQGPPRGLCVPGRGLSWRGVGAGAGSRASQGPLASSGSVKLRALPGGQAHSGHWPLGALEMGWHGARSRCQPHGAQEERARGCGCRSNSERRAGLKLCSSCLESQRDGPCIPDNQIHAPPLGLGALQAESLGAWQDLQNTAPSRPGQPSCLCEYRCQGPQGVGGLGSERWTPHVCVGDPGSVRPEGWGVAEEGFGGWLRPWVVTMG